MKKNKQKIRKRKQKRSRETERNFLSNINFVTDMPIVEFIRLSVSSLLVALTDCEKNNDKRMDKR